MHFPGAIAHPVDQAEWDAANIRGARSSSIQMHLGITGSVEIDERKHCATDQMQEMVGFPLPFFGYFQVYLGDGSCGMDLMAALHRQLETMRWGMYRQGIKAPLTNRLDTGVAEVRRCIRSFGGAADGYLLVTDFQPWGIRAYEIYMRFILDRVAI